MSSNVKFQSQGTDAVVINNGADERLAPKSAMPHASIGGAIAEDNNVVKGPGTPGKVQMKEDARMNGTPSAGAATNATTRKGDCMDPAHNKTKSSLN
jgi:hypothetical protein